MSNTLNGRCGECQHVFIVAHLPMPLDQAARLMKRAACPKCAGTKIFVATNGNSVLAERVECLKVVGNG